MSFSTIDSCNWQSVASEMIAIPTNWKRRIDNFQELQARKTAMKASLNRAYTIKQHISTMRQRRICDDIISRHARVATNANQSNSEPPKRSDNHKAEIKEERQEEKNKNKVNIPETQGKCLVKEKKKPIRWQHLVVPERTRDRRTEGWIVKQRIKEKKRKKEENEEEEEDDDDYDYDILGLFFSYNDYDDGFLFLLPRFFFFFFFTLTIDCSFFLLRKTRSERGEREAKCQEQDAA